MNILKLPRELKDLKAIQDSHHKAVKQNMQIQWRDFLVGEIQDKLRKNHNFFEGSNEAYEMSTLKRVITRFEYILNTYLREFVKISIEDWVSFIRHFTSPKLSNDELWRVTEKPCITIHLSVKKKSSKKGKKKEKGKDGKEVEEEEGEGSDDDDKHRVIYKPSLQECKDFILNSMDMICESTNIVTSLESDLMPFLQKEAKSNFPINKEFSWVVDALKQLNHMVDNNIGEPNELLTKFKEFEYVLNVDKKALVEDLFKGGENGQKKSLEEIEE